MASSPPFSLYTTPLHHHYSPPSRPCLSPPSLPYLSPPPLPTLQSDKTHHSAPLLSPIFSSKTSPFSQTQPPVTPKPPSSREEAILQAKTCLFSTLQRPLNNPLPLPRHKIKKRKQPRFRVEIPVIDDSPQSLSQLAFDVFSCIPIARKGAAPQILMFWSDPQAVDDARKLFVEMPSSVSNAELGTVGPSELGSVDVVVFVAVGMPELERVRAVCEEIYPRPVVLFNPKWGFEEEGGFEGGLGSFVGSFEVVYSFMGLEVRGILSKRKGVVLRSVRDGVVSGEGWVVLVEDEGIKGEMRVVTTFKKRPAIGDVENVLYNLMAANSPVTKSVKFIKDLASNVIGKKEK